MNKDTAWQELDALAFNILNKVEAKPITVGLSGGSDSTLVLLVAHRLRELNPNFKILACHCIHGLDCSDPIWFSHCKRLCKNLDIDIVTPRLNIVYGNGVSPEEISRKERYNALLKNLDKDGYLMLGHQADDQVESFLLALKRGSGPYGLSGMKEIVRDERGTIIRPLLNITKEHVENIIEALGFNFVFDESNLYMKFERNFVRLKVLPLLRTRFKAIDKNILRSQKLCSYEHDLAERYISLFYKDIRDDKGLNLSKLDLTDEALTLSILRRFCLEYMQMPPLLNLLYEVIDLCKSSNDQKGKILLDDFYILRRFRDHLYITKEIVYPEKDIYLLKDNDILTLGSAKYSLIKCNKDDKGAFMNNHVYLDFSYIKSTKLKIRSRHKSREIKKLFMEFDIPYFYRDLHPLVLDTDKNIIAFSNLDCVNNNKEDKDTYYKLFIEID